MGAAEEGEYIPTAYAVTTRITRAFNVPLIVRDKVTRQCPETTIFDGQPMRNRTEVHLLTSLRPYR